MPIKLCPRCGCTLTRYRKWRNGKDKKVYQKKTHRWHCRGGCGYVEVA